MPLILAFALWVLGMPLLATAQHSCKSSTSAEDCSLNVFAQDFFTDEQALLGLRHVHVHSETVNGSWRRRGWQEQQCISKFMDQSVYVTHGSGTRLGVISPACGFGVDIGPFGYAIDNVWSAAFDPYGNLYTIIYGARILGNRPRDVYAAALATVDLQTGAATQIGKPFGFEMVALEVTPHGKMYGVSWDDSVLYEIDTKTGCTTKIGATDIDRWCMDLALDRHGTMWATVNCKLWTIDLRTGASTLQGVITGFGCETFEEMVMGIMFDKEGRLLATRWLPYAKLYTINLHTLVASQIGITNTGMIQPHGGDFFKPTYRKSEKWR